MANRKTMTWIASALVGALCLSSCADLNVPDLNNPSVELLTTSPTPSDVSAAAVGLLIGLRTDVAAPNGYISMLGVLGRESYDLDPSDPRYITEMLASQLDPGSPKFGGNFWQQPYANIRNANLLLVALDQVQGLTDAEKEAARGYAKTIQALDFLTLINTRDTNGAAVDVAGSPLGTLAPIVNKAEVLAHIATLLQQAKVHLQAGGDHFPFPLSSGFTGFDTPGTFLTFNRAVMARVDVYRGLFDDALGELAESFLDTSAPLTLGVYHVFGTGSGDTLNGLISPNLYVHPSEVADAEHKPNGDIDDRVTRKIHAVAPHTLGGLTSSYAFSLYPTNTSPVPIIRNEELILLRAEANLMSGDIAAAASDLNFIRVNSGGLGPRADLTAGNELDELLRQRRYSLMFEGHRWIDLRRYGRLNTLPLDEPGFVINDKYPIPVAETDARQ